MNKLEITWVAVGVALTTATQLRVGFPVGLGEVMLCVWMLFICLRLLRGGCYFVTPLTKVLFGFWIVAFIALSFGILIAELRGITSTGVYHDGFAFIFSCVFCICLCLSIQSIESMQRLIVANISFSTISMALSLGISLPFLVPWYSGSRFTGWAVNPNQIALLILGIPFLGLHLFIVGSKKIPEKIIYLLLIATSIVLGILTDSDALKLGWAVGFFVTVFLLLYQEFIKRLAKSQQISLKNLEIYKFLLGIFIFFMILMLLLVSYGRITTTSTEVYNQGNQGSDRITLWQHGIAAISSSPVFGLGPGAHSGDKAPFLDFESHNTFIDWGGSTGMVGLAAYLSLLGWIAGRAWRNGFVVLVGAVISLATFSSFHYVLRHVIFWFYLLSIAHLSDHSLTENHFLVDSIKPIKHQT